MVKKISKESNVFSPQKDLASEGVKFEEQHLMNSENRENMQHPHSNNNKKVSNVDGNNGTVVTQDNPQVQEERGETIVQGFDLGLQEQRSQPQHQDDNRSNVSKKDSEYLKFYKFYYEKNKKEHPNWTPSQITTIISLLWKKKKNQEKNTPAKSGSGMTSRRSNKPLTAKQAFKLNHKDCTKQEIDEMWSKLPHESRNFWKKEGDSYGNDGKLSQVSSVKNCKAPLPVQNIMRTLLNLV